VNNLIKAIGLMQMSSAGLNRQSAFNEAKALALTLILQHTEGKVLVPVEATKEMLLELTNGYSGKSSVMKLRYKAMLEKAK